MEYNTSRPKIKYLEYGRGLQKVIEKLILVEDDDVRTRGVMAVINMMGQLNPNLKTYEDYKQKIWDHLILISEFKLRVNSPYPFPDPLDKREIPHLDYPKNNLRDKTYGKGVERMVEKAVKVEDEEKRKEFARIIANYLKMIQSHWNREVITDEIAKYDLQRISKGQLAVGNEQNLNNFTPGVPIRRKPNNPNNNNMKGKPVNKMGNNNNNRQGGNGGSNSNPNFKKNRPGNSSGPNTNFRNER
jgi:hypothetical protein